MFIVFFINVRDGTFIITKMHFYWYFSTESIIIFAQIFNNINDC